MNDGHPVLQIVEERDLGRIRVRVRGELDLATAPLLGEALSRLRERGEPVVLDLDELAFIDMSGLRAVLAAAEKASGNGGAFAITEGSSQVRRLIALVRLDGQLPRDGSA